VLPYHFAHVHRIMVEVTIIDYSSDIARDHTGAQKDLVG
jgi:hypothetical protein